MEKDQVIEGFVRKLLGQASKQDEALLEWWMMEHPEDKELFRNMEKFWNDNSQQNTSYVDEAYSKLLSRIRETEGIDATGQQKSTGRRIWMMQVAAAAALIFLVAAGWLWFSGQPGEEKRTTQRADWIVKQTTPAMRSVITLGDGTKIWLNADSRLEFPRTFRKNERRVVLDGEAFFEVAHNPEKPFIIELDKGTIRVLGTSFNVRAYANEETVETSVATGKVAFIPAYDNIMRQPDTFYIVPENKVAYDIDRENVQVNATVSDKDKSWIDGELNFNDATLVRFGLALERNFDKQIRFAVEDPDRIRITGAFKDDSLNDILLYMAKLTGLKYEINGEDILIYE